MPASLAHNAAREQRQNTARGPHEALDFGLDQKKEKSVKR